MKFDLKKIHKAFSLVEVVCVMVIIAVIGILAFRFGIFDALNLGRASAEKINVAAVAQAVSQYRYNIGKYPEELANLQTAEDGFGPWLNSGDDVLTDQWKHEYNYLVIESGGVEVGFMVWSYGPNGTNNSTTEAILGDDVGVISK